MTDNNIKRYLFEQYEQLALSIKNRKIRKIVFEQSYIAGGAIASLVLNEIPNDLDIYFYDKEQCKKVIAYFRKYHNDRCLKFSDNALLVYPNIHFIFKFYGKPRNTIRRFDFLHCRAFYEPNTDKLFIAQHAMHYIRNKKLMYIQEFKIDHYNVYRLMKFLEKGWTIKRSSLKKLFKYLTAHTRP